MRLLLAVLVLAGSAGCSCGSAIDGLSFACDDDGDCLESSRCVGGVCRVGAADGGAADAGSLCPAGSFSPTGDPRACTPWTTCQPGSFVRTPGSETADRECRPCAEGDFSSTANAATCSPWRTCGGGAIEVVPGQTTRDAVCSQTTEFDPGFLELPTAATFDRGGDVLVAANRSRAGTTDAVLRRLDADGGEVWVRVLENGTADVATIDAAGQVLWAGVASPDGGAFEGYLRRYDAAGALLSTSALTASAPSDGAAVGSSGVVLVGPGSSVQRLDTAGQLLWLRRLRTVGNTDPLAAAVTVDASGGVVVVGQTHDTLLGQRSAGSIDGWVWRLDASGTELWARQFGSSGSDTPAAVAVDAAGNIYVAGSTTGALPLQVSASPQDAFLRKYDADGAVLWTRQFGLREEQSISTIATTPAGEVLIAGMTRGMPRAQPVGLSAWNALVRKYDADGAERWTTQLTFGGNSSVQARSLAASLDAEGQATVIGSVSGRLAGGQSTVFRARLTP